MGAVLNLYEIKTDLKDKTFTVVSPYYSLEVEEVNRVRYRLFRKYERPVVVREGKFLIWGKVYDESPAVELPNSEEKRIILKNEGEISLDSFANERELQFFVNDVLNLNNFETRFVNFFLKKYKNKSLEWKLGNLLVIPQLITRIFKTSEKFLLHVDFKFQFVVKENLQELLEEGKISEEELRNYKLRHAFRNFTSRFREIKRATELGREFIESKLKFSDSFTAREWEKLLRSERELEKAYIIILEKGYVYPASLLKVVVDYGILDDDIAQEVARKIKLSPEKRIHLIRSVVASIRNVLSETGIKVSEVEETPSGKIPYKNILIDSKGKRGKVETNMKHFILKLIPFTRMEEVKTFVLFVDRPNQKNLLRKHRRKFMKLLSEFLNSKGIRLVSVGSSRLEVQNREEAIKELANQIPSISADFVLVFLEEFEKVDPYKEEITLYDYIKKRLLEKMIPSQVILNKTLLSTHSKNWLYILINVAEQVMAKTGNVPYKIHGQIPKADYFVGIDISRVKRGNTVNVGAFTKIFAKDGSFIKYKLLSETAYGEEISGRAIQELFLTFKEMKVEENNRIVIHRDGRFQGNEVINFVEFAKEFRYKVELVEIIKRGNPRFFNLKNPQIKGLYYKLNENTLIVATYNNIYKGTHQPIRIRRVYGEIPVEDLASQILSLTLMNYSSFQPIKLPATTHYSDKITKLLLRGIEPSQKEGNIMYWL